MLFNECKMAVPAYVMMVMVTCLTFLAFTIIFFLLDLMHQKGWWCKNTNNNSKLPKKRTTMHEENEHIIITTDTTYRLKDQKVSLNVFAKSFNRNHLRGANDGLLSMQQSTTPLLIENLLEQQQQQQQSKQYQNGQFDSRNEERKPILEETGESDSMFISVV